jgi:hypothetical protein
MPNSATRKRKPAKAKVRRAPVPQPHGGALVPGAGGGPQPGSGRPPSQLRERLATEAGNRVNVLTEIADGWTRVNLREVCEHCGKEPTRQSADEVMKLAVSASDRRSAMDTLLKYGVGTMKEVSVENVRSRVEDTLRIISAHCSPAMAESLIEAIEPVWK